MLNDKAKALLNLLYANSLSSQDELAKQLDALGLPASRQNIGKYIAQLEERKHIRYGIIENPAVHDVHTFFMEIKTNPEEPEIVTRLNEIPRIRSIDGIIGQNSLVVKICTRNDQQFSTILKQIDDIITGTRFQHYKVINCLKTFKDGGKSLNFADDRDAGLDYPAPKFESMDEQILDVMQAASTNQALRPERMSYTWIHEVAVTQTPTLTYNQVRSHVNAMIEARLIHSFTIKIAPELIPQTDFPLKFYLQILPKRLSEYDEIAVGTLSPKEEIVELYRTGEEYGLFAIARTSNISAYREFLESLYKTGKIQDTISTLVIDEKLPSTFKPFHDLPISEHQNE